METAGPDAAYLAEGTGTHDAQTATRVDALAVAARFQGYANPETGELDVWLVSPEEWEAGILEGDGTFRRTQHALNDFCIAVESLGIANSVRISTDRDSIALDNDCPVGLDGTPVLLDYTGANGAYCGQINIYSNYLFPLEHLYAEIRNLTAAYEMYTYEVKQAVGLGNGALVPSTNGNNSPLKDEFGSSPFGLVQYPNLPQRGDSASEWWIFQRPGDSDFFFDGVVVFSPTEIDNDLDEDCDGLIDEDTQSFEDGDDCSTGNDCIGGTCDCAGFPCGPGETPVCRTPYCGDTFVEGAEDCDPGTAADTAACDFDCSWAICGDDYVNAAAGEECDPGEVNGFTAACDNDCSFAVCHDGVLNTEAGEICDDGNLDNSDACVDECVPAFCGDGHTRVGVSPGGPGYEECDDANTDNSDGCIDCLTAYCGDGWVQTGVEECDGDGLGTGGETALCNANCTWAICGDGIYNPTSGEVCDEGVNDVQTSTATCDGDCTTPVCGDEYVNGAFTPANGAPGRIGPRGGENCDAGVLNNDQGACTSDCQFAYCGDGLHRLDVTDPGDPEYEACDNGDPLLGGFNSDTTPDACRTNCVAPFCGDNVIDPSGQEQCDNGDQNSDTEPGACRTDCGFFSCGDGVRDPEFVPPVGSSEPYRPAEQCDLGDTVNGNVSDSCRANCTTPTCGDGVRDINGGPVSSDPLLWDPSLGWDPEPCDDGNPNNNDDCLQGCVLPTCGDSFVWNQGSGNENCDDGDNQSGDGCSSICIVESGWQCPNPGQPCSPICGDGLLRGSEQCDDGDTNSGDGCSSSCTVENGWYCTRPNTETADTCVTSCGDGIRAGTEFCDTVNDTTTCDADDCTQAVCGDGNHNPVRGESCDDGNTNNNDGCLNTCQDAACGDNIVWSGVEQCDTGTNSQTCDGPGAGGQACTTAVCGDGYVNTSHVTSGAVGSVNPGPEVCDQGSGASGNSNSIANRCRTNCQRAQCGDGVVDSAGLHGAEECDTGTSRSNTAANACRTDCDNPSCGDGVIDANSWDIPGYVGPAPPRCDGSAGISGVQTCQGCIVDRDGDTYIDIAYGGTDCDDTNPNVNPGATESTTFLDTVDSNCDGFSFDVNLTSHWVVHSTCGGMPSSISGRCRTTLQAAIDGAGSGHRIFVKAPGATNSPIELKNGVSIYGGWNHNTQYGWGLGAGWGPWQTLESSRSPVVYNGTTTAPYHAAIIGANLSSTTVLQMLAIDANRPGSTSTDATTMHGVSISNSNGFQLLNNTIIVDGGLNGLAQYPSGSVSGRVDYPGGGVDCARPGFHCTRLSNGGQGNGWWLWSPSSSSGYFLRTNSALNGGTGGGSSIGLVLGNSPSATITGNRITTGTGGSGVSYNSVGSGGGHSVPIWFFDNSPSSSYAGFSLGNTDNEVSDCSTNTNGATVSTNILTRSSGGSGGSGASWAAGRPGMSVLCHRQANVFEWYSDCSMTGSARTWSLDRIGYDPPGGAGNNNYYADGINRRSTHLGYCN